MYRFQIITDACRSVISETDMDQVSTDQKSDSEVDIENLDSGSEDASTVVMSRKTKRRNWHKLSRLTEMLDNLKNVLDEWNKSDTSDSGNSLSSEHNTMAYALK